MMYRICCAEKEGGVMVVYIKKDEKKNAKLNTVVGLRSDDHQDHLLSAVFSTGCFSYEVNDTNKVNSVSFILLNDAID